MNTASSYQPESEAIRHFSNKDVCRDFMASLRWPDGVQCPTCGCKHVRFIKTRDLWECNEKHPKRQFSVRTGTIFEDSKLPLDKCLVAIWLEANSKNSISSYEVARALKITQKSAWFLQQRIRLAMQSGNFKQLQGDVEIDETYIGGKARNMHKGKRRAKGTGSAGKVVVMGLLERRGPIRAIVVSDRERGTLAPIIVKNVKPNSNVYTDNLSSYQGMDAAYMHQVVDHAETYVNGEVHTNGLENFWSLFKRCIKGTHVAIEPFHLFRYLDAECFRFNNRKSVDSERFAKVVRSIKDKRLTYKSLIGEAAKELPPEVA